MVADNYDTVKEIDQSYIEMMIFSLFKIDLINFIKVKALLSKEFHIQPSELELMPAWEFELFMLQLNEAIKEENERNKAEMDKAGISDAKKMADPGNISRMQKAATPEMPKMPKMPTTINVGGGFK